MPVFINSLKAIYQHKTVKFLIIPFLVSFLAGMLLWVITNFKDSEEITLTLNNISTIGRIEKKQLKIHCIIIQWKENK